jgi:hypothetical protein
MIMQKKLMELLLQTSMTKHVYSTYEQILLLLPYGVKHFREKIGHNVMTVMVRVVKYVLLILLQSFTMILLTSLQMLVLFLIDLMKVAVISLRQVWEW